MSFFSLKKFIVLFGLIGLIFTFSFKEAKAAWTEIYFDASNSGANNTMDTYVKVKETKLDAAEVAKIDPSLGINELKISFVLNSGTGGVSALSVSPPPPPPTCKGGLVPCGRSCDVTSTTDIDESKPCQLCHLFVMIDRLIDFLLINILFPIAVLMLVIAGILYVGAVFEILPGGFKTISQAKGIILSVILGLIVIFAAFILIGLFFRQIDMADWTTNIYKNWWSQGFFQINCQIK